MADHHNKYNDNKKSYRYCKNYQTMAQNLLPELELSHCLSSMVFPPTVYHLYLSIPSIFSLWLHLLSSKQMLLEKWCQQTYFTEGCHRHSVCSKNKTPVNTEVLRWSRRESNCLLMMSEKSHKQRNAVFMRFLGILLF